MPWGRLDDSLYDHPKLDALGEHRMAGVGLLAVSVSWSNRRLTDGFIPAARIALLGGTPEIAEALVSAGLFEVVEGGYAVHDFLDYNDSKEDVLAQRAENAKRQREWRKSHGQSRRDNGVSSGVTNNTPSRTSPVPSIPGLSARGPSLHERRTQEAMMLRRQEWERETGEKWPADEPIPGVTV